jgi:ATP-dependent Clp protease ATP-binding subunit ClpC
MKDLIERATKLAAKSGARLNTGFLLLAAIAGQGTASNLLKLRRLTETKIKNCLGDLEEENSDIVLAVIDKAHQVAEPFRVREPSPLHLLVAIVGFKDCHAVRILKSFNLDIGVIRTQALRCLTSVTEEHSGNDTRVASQLADKGEALPLAEQLQIFTRNPVPEKTNPAEQVQRKGYLLSEQTPRALAVRAKQLIEMGRELERKQREKRKAQSAMKGPETAGADDDALAAGITWVREEEPIAISFEPRYVAGPSASSFDLPRDEFPLLSSTGRNLSREAYMGGLDEIVGRTREMEKMADVLNKRRANSPCLVGPSGVGKTALVEGLALRLCRGEAPGLQNRVIIEIRPADLLSGTSVRGALSERLTQMRGEVADAGGRVILFFDEIHALLCSSDGAEAIQELKTALGRGELPCIAATTTDEYIRQIESDPALARRFTVVEVCEPTESEAMQILKGVEPAYRAHHEVEFADDALKAAVRLSKRYVNDRALPDKAIALLDLAGARVRRRNALRVDAEDVALVLAEQLDVPVERLASSDCERLLSLDKELEKRIVGHRHVMTALGETLRRNAAGFRNGRPIGSFLFLGPTGVGKTETAKALSDFLFPGGGAMVRLDMSEFSEAHAVARLIGAPPGYVGHEEGGQLTEGVRRRPYCLVLLDEIEKAHPDVLKLLLQVLDDGRLTDGLGRTVGFENTLIVMTSNLGSDLRSKRRHVGFGAARASEEAADVQELILAAVREAMPPELWNRIDDPLLFSPLNRDEVAAIAELMLFRISTQLKDEHNVMLEIGQGAVETLIAVGGYDPDLGARPMRRTIQRLVEGPVARMVLTRETVAGDTVIVTGKGDQLTFAIARKVESVEA